MGRSNRLFGAVVVVAMLMLGTVTGGVPVVQTTAALDSPTPLASCTTITEPGEYVLTRDLVADDSAAACLVVEVNGTVVVDGQGHSVTGGIVVETPTEEGSATFDLSNATVDRIRYPTRGDLPAATGRLSNVDVGTIALNNADGLTIESSTVRNDLSGTFAFDVVVRDSVFEGQVQFFENAVQFELVDNTFERGITFHEYLRNGTIADNEFEAGLVFLNAGGESTDVLVERNRFTLDAAEVAGFEAGGIVFLDGVDSVIRNNTITVEGDASDVEIGSNGIYLFGERTVVEGNTISGADNGIFGGTRAGEILDNTLTGNAVGLNGGSTAGLVANNTVSENDVGMQLGGSARVVNNDITDNRVGVRVSGGSVDFERNVVANSSEFGVENSATDGFVFDARNNYWGAANGPSSGPADDADAPFADPTTGRLANGDGDAVSEGQTPGVSNVRFDPFLPSPGGEEPDEERFYQVDFVTGREPLTTFGPADSDRFYTDQGRLVRFLHGSTSTPVERLGSVTTLDENASCVQVESFDVSGDTATVRYTVPPGCQLREGVLLVSYEKPGPGWSRATATEQRLVDAQSNEAFNPGTFEITVLLPTNTSTATATDARESIPAAIR